MMLSPLAIGAVTESSNLSAGDFYRESHGHIFKAILSLYAKGEPVDAITVVDELDRTSTLDGAGGAERVHELAALVPAASNAAHYARIVSPARPSSSSTARSRSCLPCRSSASRRSSRISTSC
jgi:replicative DNA helicase